MRSDAHVQERLVICKIFIKDKAKVACRMSLIEWRVVYFRKLLAMDCFTYVTGDTAYRVSLSIILLYKKTWHSGTGTGTGIAGLATGTSSDWSEWSRDQWVLGNASAWCGGWVDIKMLRSRHCWLRTRAAFKSRPKFCSPGKRFWYLNASRPCGITKVIIITLV